MTVQTPQVATQAAFDKAAKAIKGIVVPMQGVGADAYSANGTPDPRLEERHRGHDRVRRASQPFVAVAAGARQDRRRPALGPVRPAGGVGSLARDEQTSGLARPAAGLLRVTAAEEAIDRARRRPTEAPATPRR